MLYLNKKGGSSCTTCVVMPSRIIINKHGKMRILTLSLGGLGTLPVKSFADDLRGDSTPNMTGKAASYYLQNVSLLSKPFLRMEATEKQLKLMTLLHVSWRLRDIIGILSTTRKHTMSSVQQVANLGKSCFALWRLVFSGEEVQPYLFAMCYDVPVQLKRLLELCAHGMDLDTSSMSAQQSELANKVMKELIHNLSSHVHMNGEERDMAQHLSSECFRGFLHEFVTKELAFLMDMVPASTFSRKDTSSNGQCVKPGDGD